MKLNTSNIVIFFLFTSFSFIYSLTFLHTKTESPNENDLNIAQLQQVINGFETPLTEDKDSIRIRYYEAPYGELPFGYFKIIDTAAIFLYTQEAHHHRYGNYLKYYYSIDMKSRIHELSLENLKVDFADNKKFLSLIEKNTTPLHTIVDGISVINKLLIESLK